MLLCSSAIGGKVFFLFLCYFLTALNGESSFGVQGRKWFTLHFNINMYNRLGFCSIRTARVRVESTVHASPT